MGERKLQTLGAEARVPGREVGQSPAAGRREPGQSKGVLASSPQRRKEWEVSEAAVVRVQLLTLR